MNYDEMKSNEEMNTLIAEKIMGWKPEGSFHPGEEKDWEGWRNEKGEGGFILPPAYSSNILPAMEVVKKMNVLQFTLGRENCSGVRFDASFYNDPNMTDRIHAMGGTASLAICRAALKYMEVRNG